MSNGVKALTIERPNLDSRIDKVIGKGETDGNASAILSAYLYKYNTPEPPYYNDYISMNVSVTGNTRRGISYGYTIHSDLYPWMFEDRLESDTKVVFENVSDNWGDWVELPYRFNFLFYGGRYRQADRSKVWVCSNGFISFDLSNSTHPYASVIPSWIDPPDALIAALWTDLVIDDQAKIIVGESLVMPRRYLVVIWKNALDKSVGQRLTFAVAIEGYDWSDEGQPYVEQGKIYVAYQSVSSIGGRFTYGVEDHEGRKGIGRRNYGSDLGSLNGKTIIFYQNAPSNFIKHMTLRFEDQNYQNAGYDIDQEHDLIRGFNVRARKDPLPQPDLTRMFAKSVLGAVNYGVGIGGAAAVAYGLEVSVLPFTAPLGFVLVVWGFYDWYSYAQYNSIECSDLKDSFTDSGIRYAYIKVPAKSNTIVDASLNIGFYWVFKDDYTQCHNLKITGIVEYEEYPSGKIASATTSLNIEVGRDTNDNFDAADPVQSGTYGLDPMLWLGGYDHWDFYKINVGSGYVIDILMTPPIQQDFDLFLYNPWRTKVASSENRQDAQERINYQTDDGGYWFIEVRQSGGQGFYNMIIKIHGETGGCPYISVWDGSNYVLDNNVLPAAELSNGAAVEDYYNMEQTPVSQNGKYRLSLSEFEQEHSYIDQVKLLAVDHKSDINVAVTPSGEILTYTNPSPPVSAISNDNKQVKSLITYTDGSYYEGYNGSYIILNFGDLDVSAGAKLVLRTDKKLPSIHVQVQDAKDRWIDVATVHPRVYWSTDIIDMSKYLPDARGNLKVRIYFTANHKIDFAGLDTSPQAIVNVQQGELVSATHSVEGDVTGQLLYSDTLYTELTPGQSIELAFTSPQQTMEETNCIILIKGHYNTIL